MTYTTSIHYMFLRMVKAGYEIQVQFRANGWVVVTLLDKHTHDIYLHRDADGNGHIYEFKSIMLGGDSTDMEGAWANAMSRLYKAGGRDGLWKVKSN